MKAIMISIKPEWVEKILNGEKTIEIRKTMPKCELPCKVYVYETKSKWFKRYHNTITNKIVYNEYEGRGKVVAEFTLNEVEEFLDGVNCWILCDDSKTCLSFDETLDYSKGKPFYAWHINDLKIYDKPKELSDFGLKRPPQSWCYVEEEQNDNKRTIRTTYKRE